MSYTPNPSIGGTAVMSEFNNGVLATFDQVSTPHPLIDALISASQLDGWAFQSPLNGTYSSVSNAGGGQITVNTVGAHGMLAGNIVFLSSASVAGYQPPNPTVFVIQSVTATSFNVIATFTATATGNWNRGCSLVAGPGSAGFYRIAWSVSMSPVGNNKIWLSQPFQNTIPLTSVRS